MLESKPSNSENARDKGWVEMEKAISEEGGPYNPEAEILKWVASRIESKAKDMAEMSNGHLDSAAKLSGLNKDDVGMRQYHRGCGRTYMAASIHLKAIFEGLQESLDALAKKTPKLLLALSIMACGFVGCMNPAEVNPVEGRYGIFDYVPKQDSCWAPIRVTPTRQKVIRTLCDGDGHRIEWNF